MDGAWRVPRPTKTMENQSNITSPPLMTRVVIGLPVASTPTSERTVIIEADAQEKTTHSI